MSKVTQADWSVLGLVDGRRDFDAICGSAALPEAEAIKSLTKLKAMGLIKVPQLELATSGRRQSGIRPTRSRTDLEAVTSSKAEKKKKEKKGSVRTPYPTTWPISVDKFTFDPIMLGQEVEMSLEKRKQVVYYNYHLEKVTYYDLFQVSKDADGRSIRRAYFTLSKDFHPDQFFRKELGDFKARLEQNFRWVSEAYMVLSDKKKRKAYDALLEQGLLGPWQKDMRSSSRSPRGQISSTAVVARRQGESSSARQAVSVAALIARGRKLMEEGRTRDALHLFETILKSGFNATIAVQAARCLVELNERLDVADQYCRKALKSRLNQEGKRDCLIVLARILESAGRDDDARKVFLQAQRLDPRSSSIKAHLERIALKGR